MAAFPTLGIAGANFMTADQGVVFLIHFFLHAILLIGSGVIWSTPTVEITILNMFGLKLARGANYTAERHAGTRQGGVSPA